MKASSRSSGVKHHHHHRHHRNNHDENFSLKLKDVARETYSDRLRQLALPNCHLVEAVLKEHYHIFNDDCRDRLKKLLELILSVNRSSKVKFDNMNDKMRWRAIKNLTNKIKRLEDAEMMRQKQAGDHDSSAKEMRVLFKAKKLQRDDESGNRGSEVSPDAACGDHQQKTQVEEEQYSERLCNVPNNSYLLHEDEVKDEKVMTSFSEELKIYQDHLEPKWFNSEDDVRMATECLAKFFIQRARYDTNDVPSLAVKYYIILVHDMQRNCKIYAHFIQELIRPTSHDNEPYLEAAYECWMEYMSYIKHTLEYLHPYITDLVRMCQTFNPGDPALKEYETKLPRVLVNSIRNMKPWRRALSETVECCKELIVDSTQRKGSVAINIHHLYVRYYKKIRSLAKEQLK